MLKFLRSKFVGIAMEQHVDQVTAMIFREPQPFHFELLFLQRNYNSKDPYSGDLCFPGGHR